MIKRLLRTGAILIGCAVVFFGTLQCILNTSVNNINKVNMNTVYNETYSKMNKAIPTAQVVQKMDKNHYNLHDSKPKDASELDSQTSGFLDQSELRVLESTFEQSKTAESYGRFQKSFSNIYEVISGIILFLMVLVTLISSSKIADIMDYWKYLFAISKKFFGFLVTNGWIVSSNQFNF
ncbi:hypothetical protein [Fructobacillus fructosus]|uniref:hypothetical protein n=1 Tax=Fructobacillus fructosus TaxID=1631 RepID=UPI002DA0D5CC|nr:unnamed protein product [Fructobacillus fructosus]CAK1245438.1 unnamed protein product [Fructobacillus fructosus]CAK1246624.1 unnamed protein product [Fructobacillus fructosus]